MGLFDKTLPRFGITADILGEHLAIPLIQCAYSVYKGYRLRFDDGGEIENEDIFRSDSIFEGLSSIHTYLKEKPWLYNKEPIKGFYNRLLEVPRDEYLEEVYPSILKEILPVISGTGKKYYTPPTDVKSLADIIRSLNIKSVYDGNWALPLLACAMTDDIEYGIGIGDDICRAVSRVLLDFYEKKNVTIIPESLIDIRVEEYAAPGDEYVDSSDIWESEIEKVYGPNKKFDAVVVYGSDISGFYPNILHSRDIDDILAYKDESNLASKYILFVIDGLSDSHPEMLEGGKLIRLTKGYRYILVFDLAGGHDHVIFELSHEKEVIDVPYEEIRLFDNLLYPSIYKEPRCLKGMKIVRLEDIAIPSEQALAESDKKLYPTYTLSSSLDKVVSRMYRPRLEALPRLADKSLWQGTNLHLKYDQWNWKMTGCIGRSKEVYYCESQLTLAANEERIKIEYLAYVLLNDSTFADFLRLGLPVELIMHRKIAIVTDIEKQTDIVILELEKLRDVVNSDGIYSVLPVGRNGLFDEKTRGTLEGWNLIVKDPVASVYGDNGLKSLLLDHGSRQLPDAIVIDPAVDAIGTRLKGLQKAFSLSREHKIPLFVFSSLSEKALTDDMEADDLQYCKEGHLFLTKAENALRRLATAIRDELDKNGTLTTQIRSRYRQEFDAADWITNNWGVNVTKTLLDALVAPGKHLNDVRISVETLLKRIASSIAPETYLDQTKGGWLANFFMKRKLTDNEKTHKCYTLEGTLMENTLSTSVNFMYLLLNGASHGGASPDDSRVLNVLSYLESMGTENIAMAALNIYMDFIVWIAATEGHFDVTCTMTDSPDELVLNIQGITHRVSSREYYIETENPEYPKIHFWPGRDKYIPDGTPVIVKSIVEETEDRQNYKWFTKDWVAVSH